MPKARRVLGFSVFVVIALAIVTAAHRYLWLRLVIDPAWSPGAAAFGNAVITAGALSLVVYPFMERLQPPRVAAYFVWPAFVWMGACFYLLLGFGVADGLCALLGATGQAAARDEALAVLTATLVLLVGGGGNALRGPVPREVQLTLPRWPRALDGYRIVQITDIHIGATLHRGFAERITRLANAARPNLIAVTGDLVDGSVEHLAREVAPFASLTAADGVFFVAGNHDHYSGVRNWLGKAEQLGMRVLRNTHAVLDTGAARFVIAGVDDPTGRRSGGAGDDVEAALRDVPRDLPVVLLAHDPRSFDRAAAAKVDLQLSGHTHGGQMWPFGFLVRLQTRFVAGRYALGGSQLYVSVGTGFWGPPVRIFAPSELTVLVLRSE